MGIERLDPIQDFYSRTIACYQATLNGIRNSRLPPTQIPAEFVGLTPVELNLILIEIRQELERAVVLTTMAVTEDEIRMHFGTKGRRHISVFRTLYSRYGARTRFEEILEAWKILLPTPRVVSRFKEVLKYRHWLAHGRSRHRRATEFKPYEADQRARDLLSAIAAFP